MEEHEGDMPGMDDTAEPAATDAPAVDEPTGEPAAPSQSPQVSLEGFQFSPATLTVSAGTTVTWTNNEGVQHTVTADDDSFGSDALPEGGTFEFTFDTPGTYAYHCRFHGGEHCPIGCGERSGLRHRTPVCRYGEQRHPGDGRCATEHRNQDHR